MVESAGSHSIGVTPKSSLSGLAKLAARLTPQQFKDELAIAIGELKRKGIQAGIAAGLLVVGLVFAAFLAVALIVAAILGLSNVMPGWLAALIVAAVFLVIAAIAVLIGLSRFKKAMPPMPEAAMRGVQYDIGVLKEGSAFDPEALEAEKARARQDKAAKKQADERAKSKQPQPSMGELKHRSKQRRDRLASVRDSLGHKLDVKAHLRAAGDMVRARIASYANRPPEETLNTLKNRWQPLTALAVSLAALVVFTRRLMK